MSLNAHDDVTIRAQNHNCSFPCPEVGGGGGLRSYSIRVHWMRVLAKHGLCAPDYKRQCLVGGDVPYVQTFHVKCNNKNCGYRDSVPVDWASRVTDKDVRCWSCNRSFFNLDQEATYKAWSLARVDGFDRVMIWGNMLGAVE